MTSLSVVIVHHNSTSTIAQTIESIVDAGISPDRITIVDNSEDAVVLSDLLDRAGSVKVVSTPNAGYAAAVNAGVAALGSQTPQDLVLVCTHEVRFDPGAISALVDAMHHDPAATCAGPTLVTGGAPDRVVWSHGGRLSAILRRPEHVIEASITPVTVGTAREWLDGCAIIYRAEHLGSHPLPEEYFLYMEEVDYHCQIRKAGGRVIWVPGATAWQSSNGVPPFYFSRNIQIFLHRWGPHHLVAVTAGCLVLRRAARLLKDRDLRGLSDLRRGWSDGRAAVSSG